TARCLCDTVVFFCQAEDGIRDWSVTGVQTCALPTYRSSLPATGDVEFPKDWPAKSQRRLQQNQLQLTEKEKKIISALDKPVTVRSEERRVGKECGYGCRGGG